ncbi:MAG: serine hydrolase [Anaerolineales bacterium]|nr:serine hydrolase [Anaerolineales bacterium]
MVMRKILSWFLLLTAIFICLNCSRGPNTSQEQESLPELAFAQELQEAIDQALLAGQGDHDLGISAAVIVAGHRIWIGVSGNSQPGVPITPEMMFDAGSVAKNFEAALALKLAEEGALDLDDPLSKWLPPLRNVDSDITIRQLLNHTSGIFNLFENPDFPWVDPNVDYSRSWKLEEVFDTLVLEPYGPPGVGQHYSSTNYLLLTAIIEKASGLTVAEGVERYFLEPMNLERTFMSMGEPLPAYFSAAHPWVDVDRDGELDDLIDAPITWKVTLTHPVIYTTPGDLACWLHALYHEQSVLAPDSLKEMLTYADTPFRDPDGGIYGLGVVDYSELLGVHVIGHAGSSLGYSAAALYFPEYGTAVAWLINTGESPRDLANAIMTGTWSSLSEVLRQHLEP